MAGRLGDRVAQWIPVNEPNVVTMIGYGLGLHAPGRTLMFDALPVAHHLLLGHGLAVRALRAAGAQVVGTATNHTPVWPAADSADDRAAADLYDVLWNRLFADPMLLGHYPEGFAELMPGPVEEDLRLIAAPLDFYGFNYYNPTSIRAPREGAENGGLIGDVEVPPGLGFEFVPMPGYPPPTSAGRSSPRGSTSRFACWTRDIRTRRRCTSPSRDARSASARMRTEWSTTSRGSTTSTRTCGPSRRPFATAPTYAATTPGR